MLTMMVMMYSWVWENEYASEKWREGVFVKLFNKRDNKADRGNYLEMMLSRTVCQKNCDILNDNTGTMLEKEKTMSKGDARLRSNLSCINHVYTLGKISNGSKNAGL